MCTEARRRYNVAASADMQRRSAEWHAANPDYEPTPMRAPRPCTGQCLSEARAWDRAHPGSYRDHSDGASMLCANCDGFVCCACQQKPVDEGLGLCAECSEEPDFGDDDRYDDEEDWGPGPREQLNQLVNRIVRAQAADFKTAHYRVNRAMGVRQRGQADAAALEVGISFAQQWLDQIEAMHQPPQDAQLPEPHEAPADSRQGISIPPPPWHSEPEAHSEPLLRELALEDWPAVHRFASLSSHVRPWLLETEDESRSFVEEAVAARARSPQDRLVHVVSHKGDLIGLGCLDVRNRAFRQAEMVFILHPMSWGWRMGNALGRSLLAQGFEQLNLHRIYAICDPRNVELSRVLNGLGMTFEGRHRHTILDRDRWCDSDVFSLLEEEWTRSVLSPPVLPAQP